jgi:pSer/pThr/pTyr-binding forkhead associated (FHA) protein
MSRPSAATSDTDIHRTADGTQKRVSFGAPHVFVLASIDGDNPGFVHRIVQTETLVGRGDESQIPVESDKVSRIHCRIRVEGSVCTLFDSGSRNGTSINGRKLAANVGQRLRHLDEIEVGGHRFLLAGKFRDQAKNPST